MQETKDDLIRKNANLVRYVIDRCYPTLRHDDDLYQVGLIGLWKAIERYDPQKGAFSSYAYSCIRCELADEFRRRGKQRLKTISLDTQVTSKDSEVRLGDIIPGDKDVPYVDTELFLTNLSPLERTTFEALTNGNSPVEIARDLGVSRQAVHKTCRRIRRKWRDAYGD